jgi:hypothetical protein
VRAGVTPALRASVLRNSTGSKPIDAHLRICPNHGAASGGKGLTATDMEEMPLAETAAGGDD